MKTFILFAQLLYLVTKIIENIFDLLIPLLSLSLNISNHPTPFPFGNNPYDSLYYVFNIGSSFFTSLFT